MNKKPHIVIFNPDQWRGDVMGHLGNPAAVTPSRCSFMTGWYPHVRGHRTMHHMLRPDEPVLLRTLKENGYFVWWGGKNDLVPAQNDFADYCNVKHHSATRYADLHNSAEWRGEPDSDTYYSFYYGRLEKDDDDEHYLDHDWSHVLGAIELIKNAPPDQPLCIYLPLLSPHPPYAVEDPYYTMIDRARLPNRIPSPDWSQKPGLLNGIYRRQNMQSWTEDRWAELRATYYGMCARVDDQFGLVLNALKEAGIYDDTAIFFFSDHGDFTGDYGLVEKTQNTFEDCLTHVPFIIKPPASVPAKPRISTAMIELIDFPATVEALTGIAPRHTHFGRSLLPLLAGETDEHREAVFCEGGRTHGERHCMELESNSHQEPSGLYWPRVNLQQSEGPEHTKAVMCRTKAYKYVRRLYEPDELYDLRDDPAELHNRIDDPALAGVLTELKERLLTFYLETGDVVPHDPDHR